MNASQLLSSVNRQDSYVDANGIPHVITHAFGNETTAGNKTLVAPVATARLRLIGFRITVDAACNVTWIEDVGGANTALSSVAYHGATGGITDDGYRKYYETGAINRSLGITMSAAVNLGWDVWYVEI